MKAYIHKVNVNSMDGWGSSRALNIEILGYYSTKEKAHQAKNKRDNSQEATLCDVGHSWIEELEIQ